MSQPEKTDLITVNIDGKDIDVPKGTNMIEAAAMMGVEIPHYCYHPKLSVVGNCRMCLVELGMPMRDRATGEPIHEADGSQKIGWMPRPAIACSTMAAPGMRIRTQTELVKDCRNGVMEFLLINHPLDCPICDQAGECRLQEFATDYGRGYSRFVEEKNVKPKRTSLGPLVTLDDERCILCSRCIRFCKEVAGDDVLGFTDRGSYTTLTCYPGKRLENNYSLNTVDICPVGALTNTDFRFQMRVWFLRETPGICPESSAGVNTLVWSREGVIYRITPRRNDDVNDTWMSDSGRMLYKQVHAENRITAAFVDGKTIEPEQARAQAVSLLKDGPVAVVGSGRSSVEEQFLLRKLSKALSAVSADLVSRVGESDGILISADRNPNVRGALITGLIDELPSPELSGLASSIREGKVRTLLVVGEDLTEAGIPPDLLDKVQVVYVGTHSNPTSEKAAVVLPSLTVFEKQGSFINQQYRLQKFERAVPGPAGVLADIDLLADLLRRAEGGAQAATFNLLWEEMADAVPALRDKSFRGIPPGGVLLDIPDHLKSLPYVETAILHFKPQQPAVGAST